MEVKMECPIIFISSDTVDDQTSPTRPRKVIKLSNPESDMFETKTSSEDTCLKVEGKCLFVSSSILSLVSPDFMSRLEEKVDCSDPLEIELEGKKYEDILEFLKCIHPCIMKRLSMENIPVVLPLAFEYGVKPLLSNCISIVTEELKKIDFDIDDDPVHPENICLYLAKAFEYNLPDLKVSCLELAVDNYYLLPKEKVKSLPVEAKAEVQGRVIEEIAKKNAIQAKFCQLQSVRGLGVLMEQFSGHESDSYMRNPRVGYLEYTFDAREKDAEETSDEITVHDINWCIQVRTNKTALDVFLNGEMSKECTCYASWKCRVFATVRLHNFKYCFQSMNKTMLDRIYKKSAHNWGFREFAKMEDILDPAKSFTKDGSARLEIYMYAEEPTFE